MPVTSEVTSDYSGSLTPTSSGEENEEEEEEEDDNAQGRRVSDSSSLLWAGTGGRKVAFIMFRPESLIGRDKKLKSIGEKYHLAYKMVKTESKLVRSVLSTYGFHEVHPNSPDFNLMWTGAHLKPFSLRSLQDFQKVNHFPRSYEITRKDRLFKNIDRMAHTKGAKHFDFMPRSYLMPSEYQDFCAAYVKDKGPWIVKPIASSRGRGIYLINNPNQVPLEDNIMVCKYIGNPLLIDGFKFDVRVYIAVTSYDPLMIYLFEEGLTRFATVKYEKTNRHLKNQMMHLTNYSINKKSHDYVRCEDPDVEDYGNKWSMSAMLRYLKQEGIDTTALMMRIESVIIKAIISAELPIATACKMFVPNRENCMELYGFDILVDENLKPWLLEGNLSPSLACDAPLDLKIKSCMISDFFSLVGFQCVDPLTRRQKKDQIRRPYSASKGLSGASSMQGTQSKRPVSASAKESSTSGLSSEEAKVLRIAKEQYQRRGSFIRIFPTPETWELYGSFLEYKSSLNLMLAQKLFPDRVKSKAVTGAYSSAVARMRSLAAGQMLESRNRVMSERFMQYERKLLSLESLKHKRGQKPRSKKRKATPVGVDNKALAQGQLRHASRSGDRGSDDSDEEECEDEESDDERTQTKELPKSVSKTSAASLSSSSKTAISKQKKQTAPRTVGGAGDLHPLTKSAYASARTRDAASAAPSKSQSQGNGVLASSSKTSISSKSGAKSAPKERSLSVPPSRQSQRVYAYKTSEKKEVGGSGAKATDGKRSEQNPNNHDSTNNDSDGSLSESDGDKTRTPKTGHKPTIGGRQAAVGGASPRTKQQKKTTGVLEALKAGGNLGKVQARQAFSAYLSRVQQRLMLESESHSQENPETVGKQEEQMDLVLRFLKRAAGNLRQSFSVVVPSRRLCLRDRKRILAKQLGDFVHIYNKETDAMEQKQNLGLDKDASSAWSESVAENVLIRESDFHFFVLSASETELEEVLTTYTHKNKSASVFLGASKPKSREKKEIITPAPSIPTMTRPQSTKLTERLPAQPLVQTGHMYQAEEHRESLYELNLHRRGSPGFLRMRSPSPSPSITSLSSRGATGLTQQSGGQSSLFQPHQSSLQQAAYIYSAKLTPPTSMAGVAAQQTPQKRPSSARDYNASTANGNQPGRPISASSSRAGLQSGSLHYQTAANEEAIADALQKLAERQAARQYSATSQLQALTQHLSSINLANMSAARQHHIGQHQHTLGSQRASSLSDLASGDPSIQSMIDPSAWETESSRAAAAKAGQSGGGQQALAQQSKELLQQSRAKHQAMVAQMLDDWDAQSKTEASPVTSSQVVTDVMWSLLKTDLTSLVLTHSSEERGLKGDGKTDNKELEHRDDRQETLMCATVEAEKSCMTYGDAYVPVKYEAPRVNKDKNLPCKSVDETKKAIADRFEKQNTEIAKANRYGSSSPKQSPRKHHAIVSREDGKGPPRKQIRTGGTENGQGGQKQGKKPQTRVESVWNSHHVSVTREGRPDCKNRKLRTKKAEGHIVKHRNSEHHNQNEHVPRAEDDRASASASLIVVGSQPWVKNAVEATPAQTDSVTDKGFLPGAQWRYQNSGQECSVLAGSDRVESSMPHSEQCEETDETPEVKEAHNAVTNSMSTKLSAEDTLQNSSTQRTPLLTTHNYTGDGSSRPPQVPRPPERPKPAEKQPPIRKPLGGSKITRIGSHPQLTGLSPNPSSLTLADDNYNMNFYNNLKYDPSTGATKVVDGSESYRMNGIAAESGSRPSSAKRPTWKP